MAAITYNAIDRGELISGHSALTSYSFEVNLASFSRSTGRKINSIPSLSGAKTVHTFHRLERRFSLSTRPTRNATEIDNMREFLSSVAGGETFTLDPFGTITTPDAPKDCFLNGDYTESRADGGFVSFSFGVVTE